MIAWPIFGAMTGIAMNTIITSDMTLAMRRPPKQSRTTEMAMTRVAAAPMPCMARSARSSSKVGEKIAATDGEDVDGEAEEQDRTAAEPVGERPVDDLRAAEAQDVGGDHELPLVRRRRRRGPRPSPAATE